MTTKFQLVPTTKTAPDPLLSVALRRDQWELLSALLGAIVKRVGNGTSWLDYFSRDTMRSDIDAIAVEIHDQGGIKGR
jgi:hypothetical protein